MTMVEQRINSNPLQMYTFMTLLLTYRMTNMVTNEQEIYFSRKLLIRFGKV